MSLVVAKLVGTSLFAIADTKITNPREPQNPFTEGVAKLFLLGETRFVGFAGEFHDVREVVGSLDPSWPDGQVLAALQRLSEPDRLDFLFGRLGPPASIVKISRGCVTDQETWIGDHEAFRMYQGYLFGALSDPEPTGEFLQLHIQKCPELETFVEDPGTAEYFAMFSAFKRVIESGRADSVAGFILPIVTEKGRLQHPYYYDVWCGQVALPSPGEAFSLGTTAEGAFSVNFGSVAPDVFVAYVDEAQVGLLFDTRLGSSTRCVPQLLHGDEIDVDRLLKSRFGAGVPFGRKRTPGHFYVKAAALAQDGSVHAALELFDEGIAQQLTSWANAPSLPSSDLLKQLGLPAEHQNLRLALEMRGRLRILVGHLEGGTADWSAAGALQDHAARTA